MRIASTSAATAYAPSQQGIPRIIGRVAHLVRPPAAGVEAGETNIDEFSWRRWAQKIRVPHLTASLMRWATRPALAV